MLQAATCLNNFFSKGPSPAFAKCPNGDRGWGLLNAARGWQAPTAWRTGMFLWSFLERLVFFEAKQLQKAEVNRNVSDFPVATLPVLRIPRIPEQGSSDYSGTVKQSRKTLKRTKFEHGVTTKQVHKKKRNIFL